MARKTATRAERPDETQQATGKSAPVAIGDRFRNASQAQRLADPELRIAAKALAYANGHLDAAYGRSSPKALAARELMKNHIARVLDSGRPIKSPLTRQRVPAIDPTRDIDRPDRSR